MKWRRAPNLRHRPPAPALGNGRVQRLARRAMIALGYMASTSAVLDWTACRKLRHGQRAQRWDYGTARRALEQIGAVRVGRAESIGRPWLWRLKSETLSDADD